MTGSAKALIVCIFLVTHAAHVSGQKSYAIKNISVIPMTTEAILANQTVVIKNGIITGIDDSQKAKLPKSMEVIDGRGKYLIPGLFDMHAHFFQEQGHHRDTNEAELSVMLANGLTTVRIMAGHPSYMAARDQVRTGRWKGPELFIASPQLVGRWPWPSDFRNFEIVDSPVKGREAVKRFKADQYDEIKLTFMVTVAVYDEVTKTARDEHIKVTGHVGPQVALSTALAAKQQIEHMDEFLDRLLPDTSYNHGQSVSDMNIWRKNAWATVPYLDESRIPDLVRQVKASGVFVTPTNFFFFSSFGEEPTDETYKQRPDYAYIPPEIKEERWKIKNLYWNNAPLPASRARYVELRKKITYALWNAGVPLMAGSDSPEWFLVTGFSIYDELQTFVDAGLTPYAALVTATVNTARYLDLSGKKGTIEVGKQADLVILDQNPLENIANTRKIHAVVRDGQYFNREAIAEMLKKARNVLIPE